MLNDKLGISMTVTGKFCGDDEPEWENNPYIHKVKEINVTQDEGRISSLYRQK